MLIRLSDGMEELVGALLPGLGPSMRRLPPASLLPEGGPLAED